MTLTDNTQQPPPALRKGETAATPGWQARSTERDTGARGNYRDRNHRGAPRKQPDNSDSENDVALSLVTRAASTIDVLQGRCNQLEGTVTELRDQLKTEAENSQTVIKDWERLATAMKSQLQDCETRIAGLQERLQAAEARAEAGELRAQAAEQQVDVEEEISSSLREKILSAFGSGSQVQATIEAVVSTDAAPGAKVDR